MSGVRRFIIVCLTALIAGCGGKGSGPSPPGSGESERIRGNERLGWDQPAVDAAELSTFSYAIYVDGARSVLSDVSCGSTAAAAGFPCSARMPSLSGGTHVLEIAAFIVDNGAPLESPRSAPLRVTVAAGITAPISSSVSAGPNDAPMSNGARLDVEWLVDGFDHPVALAFAPDGRVMVAERRGRVLAVREGQIDPRPVHLPAADSPDDPGGVLGLVLDPNFEQNRFAYLLMATGSRNGTTFRLERFRDVGNRFGERVVLLDRVPASPAQASGALGFGPDGKLYAALDDGGDPARVQQLSSYNGKILRLNADGTTPRDQASMTPVYSIGQPAPRGFDWQPTTGALWAAGKLHPDAEQLCAILPDPARGTRGATRVSLQLPSNTGASALQFYRGDLIPDLRGNLLVAADEARHILRIQFDAMNPLRIASTERLLQDRFEHVRALGVDREGAVYVCTHDALVKLGPSVRK
jgi:glucose/arabinose dehydrogenase